MPEDLDRGGPEELLAGSDRPRPLPPVLEARLERSLFGLSGTTAPRPLSPEVRDRLENSLRRPGGTGRAGGGGAFVPGAGVAAAIAVLAAIVCPSACQQPQQDRRHGRRQGGGPGGGTSAGGSSAPGPSPGGTARSFSFVLRRQLRHVERKGRGYPPWGGAPWRAGPFCTRQYQRRPGAPPGAAAHPDGTGPSCPRAYGGGGGDSCRVGGVSPHHGPTGGGNWVVVTGHGFVGVSAVHFGATAATSFAVESPLRLKVRAPATPAGTVDVIVTGATGRSRVAALDKYRFGP